jgi:hypothetical protein
VSGCEKCGRSDLHLHKEGEVEPEVEVSPDHPSGWKPPVGPPLEIEQEDQC